MRGHLIMIEMKTSKRNKWRRGERGLTRDRMTIAAAAVSVAPRPAQ